jgi:hypothetical protein
MEQQLQVSRQPKTMIDGRRVATRSSTSCRRPTIADFGRQLGKLVGAFLAKSRAYSATSSCADDTAASGKSDTAKQNEFELRAQKCRVD